MGMDNDKKYLEINSAEQIEENIDKEVNNKVAEVKRLTQLPKIIGVAGLILFFAFIFLAANFEGVGILNPGKKDGTANQPRSSEQMATQLVFNMPDGHIVADKSQPKPTQSQEKDQETPKQADGDTKPDTPILPKLTDKGTPVPVAPTGYYREGPPLPNALSEDEINVLRFRRQMFEQGLMGKSSINPQMEQLKQSVAVQAGSNRAGNLPADANETVQRLNTIKQNLAAAAVANNNESEQFLQQLASLRGGGGGSSVNFASAGSNSFAGNAATANAGGDRWLLDAGGKPQPPRSLCEVRAGTIIPAIMVSGINSDLPGQIIGQVTQDIYDTATGRYLVIPQGTKLVGSYNNEISFGQERVLMVWQRLIFPDGRALDLGSMPGADQAGYAGLTDIVETHFWRTMGAAFMMSLVIAGVEISQNDYFSDKNGNSQRAGDALSESLGQTMGNTMSQFIQRYMSIQTTIIIRPGNLLNVMVTKDIPFEKPYQEFNYN